MATLQDVIDSIRGATDQVGSPQLLDATLKAWINEDYIPLVRKTADIIPGRYTKVAALTIAAGATVATGVPADFAKPRKLVRVYGIDQNQPVPRAPFATAEAASHLCYLQRGANTIEVYPRADAPGTYSLSYVYKPTALAAAGDVLDLPDGVERSLVQTVCVRVRIFAEEETLAPHHVKMAERFWEEDAAGIAKEYPDDAGSGCVDVTGVYGSSFGEVI